MAFPAMVSVSQTCEPLANLQARQHKADVLETRLREAAISDKDSAIATLEHQLHETTTPPTCRTRRGSKSAELAAQRLATLKQLKKERSNLMTELKEMMRERLSLLKRDSEEVLGALASQHQSSNKRQVCDVLRSLERQTQGLKAYIDQLLAVILEREPSLMEGLPRIQQGSGLDLDLLSAASKTELLEELDAKERRCISLQEYADLLLHRIETANPDYLSLIQH